MSYGKLEAVLFDMDGVIIDSGPVWTEAERRLLAPRGLTCFGGLKELMLGRNAWEAVSLLKEHYHLKETIEDLVDERDRIVADLLQQHQKPVPHALNLVSFIRIRGIKTALASSSARTLIELVLETLQICHLFDLYLSGEEVANGKPAPDIYLAAAEKLQVSPLNCLVIEDSPCGVKAAKAAGMRCLAITTSVSKVELTDADCVIDDFKTVDPATLKSLLVP